MCGKGNTIVEAGPHITVGHPNKVRVFKAAERNQLCSLDIDCLRAQAGLLPNFFPPGAVPMQQ